MKIDSCREAERIMQSARPANWPEALRAHLETCASCRATRQVVLWMTEMAARLESLAGAAPDPGLIWLKARLHRRSRLPGRALLPLQVGALLGAAGFGLLLAAVPRGVWDWILAWRPSDTALAQLQHLSVAAPAPSWWIPAAASLLFLLVFTASET